MNNNQWHKRAYKTCDYEFKVNGLWNKQWSFSGKVSIMFVDVTPLWMRSSRTASAIIYLVHADVGTFNNNNSKKTVILNNDNRWTMLLEYVTSQVKRTLDVSLMKRWLAAVMSSSLPTGICQKSYLWRWSRSGISLCDCLGAQPGFTYSGVPSASANQIVSVLIYVTICHIIIYLELLVLSLSVLHHVFMLLWQQKQCS